MKIQSIGLNQVSQAIVGSEVAEPIYSTNQVLEVLKISRRSLQSLRDEGLIEFSKVKGKLFYRHSAIVKMLENHSVKPF